MQAKNDPMICNFKATVWKAWQTIFANWKCAVLVPFTKDEMNYVDAKRWHVIANTVWMLYYILHTGHVCRIDAFFLCHERWLSYLKAFRIILQGIPNKTFDFSTSDNIISILFLMFDCCITLLKATFFKDSPLQYQERQSALIK